MANFQNDVTPLPRPRPVAPLHYKQHSPHINPTDAKTIFKVLIYEH